MKHNLKQALATAALLLCSMVAMAQTTATVDGITYEFITKAKLATVVKSESGSYSGNIVIPEIVEYLSVTYSVTEIGSKAFYLCRSLTSITIPNSVTTIGKWAFYETGWWNNQPDGLIYKDGWLLGYKGDEPSGDIVIADGTKRIWFPNGQIRAEILSNGAERYWDENIICTDNDYAPCTFEVIEEVPATCLVDGSTTYKCTVCGHTYTETVTARGHHNFDYEDRDETNHFSICADCGEAYNIEPHTEYLTETVVPATCEAQGYTEYMCTYCFYTYKDNYVDALGHNWGEWTDNGDGTHTRVCANDSEHTETVPHVGMDDCVCDDCGFASHVTHDGNIFDCDICGADTSFTLIDSEHMSPDVSFTPEQIGTETLKDGDKILIGYTHAYNTYYDFTTEENVGYKITLGTDKAGYVDLNKYLVEVVKNDDGTYSFLTNFGKYLAMDSTGALMCLDTINGDSSWTIVSYGPGNDMYEAYITEITNVGQGRILDFTENPTTRAFEILKFGGTVIKVFRGVNVGHEMSVECNDDNTHTYVCTGCDLNGVEDCHGGTATCTDKAICDVCNSSYGDALGHAYPDTWTDNGDNHIKVCANGCGIDLTETHTYEETDRTPADCLNAEVITLTCACGNSFTEEGAPATGHDYSWIDNGDGTCTGTCANDSSHVEIADHIDDNTDEICDNCGANLHVHQWSQWTFSPDGTTHTRVCLLDDSHVETGDHTGMETDCTCDVCGGANHVTHDNNMTDCDKCGAIFNEKQSRLCQKRSFKIFFKVCRQNKFFISLR